MANPNGSTTRPGAYQIPSGALALYLARKAQAARTAVKATVRGMESQ
jgi:hypothetical protein